MTDEEVRAFLLGVFTGLAVNLIVALFVHSLNVLRERYKMSIERKELAFRELHGGPLGAEQWLEERRRRLLRLVGIMIVGTPVALLAMIYYGVVLLIPVGIVTLFAHVLRITPDTLQCLAMPAGIYLLYRLDQSRFGFRLFGRY
jgi:hypothetical protein